MVSRSKPLEIRKIIEDSNPRALFFHGYDEALIGIVEQPYGPLLPLYSFRSLHVLVMRYHSVSMNEAIEYVESTLYPAVASSDQRPVIMRFE